MKPILVALLAVALTSDAQTHSGRTNRIVTAAWVAEHLNDRDLVLLHSGWTRGGYKNEHIPGARFLWLNGFAQGTPDLSTELPEPGRAESMLKELGITNESRIVVYFENQSVTMTARMILTFDYLGLGDRVSFMDGGIEAWKREGRPVTKDIPRVANGSFKPVLHPEFIADAEWIKANLGKTGVTVIDARSARFYSGTDVGSSRPGHIPGAVNIPFTTVMDSTSSFLPVDSLRQLFVKAGVQPGNKVVTYCHVGQQASLIYFVARLLGYEARLYDGSFEDWSSRLELPVDNPAEKK